MSRTAPTETLPATERTPFTWGVASGDPTAESVVLWTRIDLAGIEPAAAVEDSARPETLPTVHWQIWESGQDPAGPVAAGVGVPEADGTVDVQVTGLAPGRRYSYRFGVHDEWSETASTSTLDPDAASIRLGIACCARLASGPLEAYEGLRLSEPDLIVHLGDYIYEDGGSADDARLPEPPHECRDLEDYSARYAQYRRDENLQRLHRSAPWFLIPDDHEITDDAFPPDEESAHPPVDAPSSDRYAAALAAYRRWLPRVRYGNGPTEFDRHVPLGRIADLVMVDTRLGGREQPAGTGPTKIADPDHDQRSNERSLLTESQWQWLEEVIVDSDRPWLIIASQVQVAPLRLGWRPRWSWPPAWRPIVNPDQWDGYPADRARLIALLDRHDVDHVLIISGDLHARFVTTIERGDRRRIVEVTTPSVTAPTFASLIARRLPLPKRWRAWRLAARWIRLINPHIVEMDLDRHGTTLLDVDGETIVVTGLSPSGATTHRWTVTKHGLSETTPD